MDPYIYPNTNVLINKLNIRDEQQLIDVEAQLLIAGIIDISSITHEIDFQNIKVSKRFITSFFMSYIYGQENSAQSIFIKANMF